MSATSQQPYNATKVDQIYELLNQYSEAGAPAYYKIKVDGLEVVRRTQDLTLFYCFEGMVDLHTSQVEIIIFQGRSMHSDKHLFYFHGIADQQAVTQQRIDDAVEKEVIRFKYEHMEKENKKLKEEHKKQQLLIRELKEKLYENNCTVQGKGSPVEMLLGGDAGQILLQGVERIINPLSSVKTSTPPAEPALTGITYKDLSEEDNKDLAFVQSLRGSFSFQELNDVLYILDQLKVDKERIVMVKDQLSKHLLAIAS